MSELKHAVRRLGKTPGFTVVAVLVLAIAIGACTAVFSVVNAVLLKPLPFRDPDRLAWIENDAAGGLSGRTSRTATLQEWRQRTQTFESIAGYFAFFDYMRLTVTGAGEPEQVRGVPVTDNFIDTLGIKLLYGRGFTPEECTSFAQASTAVMSYGYWQRRFAGDPGVVGRTLTLNDRATTIIGILPSDFDFDAIFSPGTTVDFLTPFPVSKETDNWGNTVFCIGRLKSGASFDAARAEFAVMTPQIMKEINKGSLFGFRLRSLDDALRSEFRPAFKVLAVAVLAVLATACVNISSLLLARLNRRRQEFAVRLALGAKPRHLVQQVMLESLLLSVAGSAIGLGLALVATKLLSGINIFGVPFLKDISIDWVAGAVTVGLTVLAGFGCGLLPALQASSRHGLALHEAGPQRSSGRRTAVTRDGLIVAEITLAFLLLVTAGLMLRSFQRLLQVNPGFQPRHAMSWRVDGGRSLPNEGEGLRYFESLVQKVAAIPGVNRVGLSDCLPLGRNRTWGIAPKGAGPDRAQAAFPRLVDAGYLPTMEIPLVKGRYFDSRDTPQSEKVVIVNETLAQRLFPDRDAVGQVVSMNVDRTVIGVVRDVRHSSLEQSGGSEMYFPYTQIFSSIALEMVVRTERPIASVAADIRKVFAEHDPSLPAGEFRELESLVADSVAPRRFQTLVLGAFAAVSLLLAAVGLYGVIAYAVTQRTQEIGIRMALGAQPGSVLQMILAQGLRLGLAGITVGAVAAYAFTRILRSQLYGITEHDPIVFAGIALLLLATAVAASFLPAYRATRISPLIALRAE